MKKLALVMGLIFFSFVAVTNLFAVDYVRGKGQMMMNKGNDHGRGDQLRLWAKLNLTEDQKARIKALREAHQKDVKPLRDEMFSKRGDMKLLWLQPTPDKEKILALQKEIRALRDQMQDKATANRVDMFNILTPEQKDKFKAAGVGRGMKPGKGAKGMMEH